MEICEVCKEDTSKDGVCNNCKAKIFDAEVFD